MATYADLGALLKKFYAKGVVETVNQEVEVFKYARKGQFSWSGLDWNYSLHTRRGQTGGGADTFGWAAENAALPGAGAQGYSRMTGSARYVYGKISVSGPVMEAGKNDAGSVLPTLDSEVRGATDDVTFSCNRGSAQGGLIKGFVFERKDAGAGAAVVWQFCGNSGTGGNADYLVDANTRADIIRMDNFNVIAHTIPVVSMTENTITLDHSGGGSAVLDTRTATCLGIFGGVPVALPKGVGFAVRIWNTVAGVLATLNAEMHGVMSCLVDTGTVGAATVASLFPSAQSVNQPSATVNLRPNIRTVVSSSVDGDYGYGTITTQRLQDMFQLIRKSSGKAPFALMINPATLSSYTALLQGTSAANLFKDVSSAAGGDAGFNQDKLGFNNVPWLQSQNFGVGQIAFLEKDSWKLAVLADIALAQADGKTLNKVTGTDAYEGFVRGYLEQVCVNPHANGILTGVSYTAL